LALYELRFKTANKSASSIRLNWVDTQAQYGSPILRARELSKQVKPMWEYTGGACGMINKVTGRRLAIEPLAHISIVAKVMAILW
jgi:hypothetical protein